MLDRKIRYLLGLTPVAMAVLLALPGQASAAVEVLGCRLDRPPASVKRCLEGKINDLRNELNGRISNLERELADARRTLDEVTTDLQSKLAAAEAKIREAEDKLREADEKLRDLLVDVAGETGGAPYFSACGAGSVMVGLKLRSGSYVDAVQAICARVNPDGTWRLRAQVGGTKLYWISYGASAGGSGGSASSQMCPAHQGVVALHGRSGYVVDRLAIQCGRLAATGTGVGGVTRGVTRPAAGGDGGTPFVIQCAVDRVAVGVAGRSAHYINQIGAMCASPASVP